MSTALWWNLNAWMRHRFLKTQPQEGKNPSLFIYILIYSTAFFLAQCVRYRGGGIWSYFIYEFARLLQHIWDWVDAQMPVISSSLECVCELVTWIHSQITQVKIWAYRFECPQMMSWALNVISYDFQTFPLRTDSAHSSNYRSGILHLVLFCAKLTACNYLKDSWHDTRIWLCSNDIGAL